MKKLVIIVSLVSLSFNYGCKGSCVNEEIAACKDTVPEEACLVAFTNWFYDAKSQSCQEISYSACSPKGFTTKVECDECKCK